MKDESYGYPGGLRLANIADECIPKIGLPADGMDNDCDYRIDEELANGLDDDGDGVIDEDLAAAPPRLIIPGDYSDQVCIINTTPDETGRARGTVAHKCQQRGVTSITYTDTGLSSTACEKRLVRKWELRDGCGHIVNGNQTIEQHIKEPVIRFPLDIDVYIKCDEYRADWENNEVPQVLETCPYHNITFHRDTTAGVCDGERTMVRHVNWTATDQCGKRQHHLQTININPQASNQIMDVQCNSVQLEVQVDVAKLNAQYENIDMTSLRLLDRGCTPFRSGSKLIFNIPLGACGTQRKETDNAIMYSNRIQSVSSSSERHRPPSSIISRGRALMLPFDCVLHKHATVAREFQRKGHNVIGRVHVVHGNFTIHMNMFKDKNYRIPIVQFPYFVAFGDTVFWSVKLATSDPNLKLIVQMCEATPFPSRTYPTKYFLVKDRCPTDPTLHIQSASPKEVKLDFEVFEFIRKIGLVYVYCDVTICTSEDTSPHCSQECSSTSGAPPTEGSTGHQLKRREANHKHTALNHYDLYTGPLVYREKTSKVDPQSSSKLTVAASKPENGLEIPWPAVILVAIALVALLVAVALLLFVSKKK
ncbi:uncharacterized protein LOC106168141 [Lingula anatina]|uniref:Uncharacterized protein LOC106168141 n=1 Tax=Lingula anatina TaxID=7574 RepID=A0A1S3IX56_LINAN|nr:uncharacterized protein LOC106168141 [Lingula anatina]|eukprot:XP_013402551.1 uncharacterized protein LOC106168141 [Lingula anatina]